MPPNTADLSIHFFGMLDSRLVHEMDSEVGFGIARIFRIKKNMTLSILYALLSLRGDPQLPSSFL